MIDMNAGIVGLGLIGGSFAKTVKENGDMTVFGCDTNESSFLAAKMTGAVDGRLTEENIGLCDIIIISLYPRDTVEYVKKHAHLIKKGAIVTDTCGVKKYVCEALAPICAEHGFDFIGCHPMAGTQYSGFSHSKATLFKGASMIMCPGNTSLDTTEKTKQFFISLGFGSVVFCTPEFHDSQIAFTSQLAHVVSNAYIKSPAALEHKGFSAGSYKDLTRVARLNPIMWSELFMENKENLCREIDGIIEELKKYSDALKNDDKRMLEALLADGVAKKLLAERLSSDGRTK